MIELLVVITIVGILASIAALNLRGLDNPLQNAQRQIQAGVTLARTRALGSTSAVMLEIAPGNAGVIGKAANTCPPANSPKWTARPDLSFTLPEGVLFVTALPNAKSVCFTSRGLASANATFRFTHPRGTKAVEIMLGGQTRSVQ